MLGRLRLYGSIHYVSAWGLGFRVFNNFRPDAKEQSTTAGEERQLWGSVLPASLWISLFFIVDCAEHPLGSRQVFNKDLAVNYREDGRHINRLTKPEVEQFSNTWVQTSVFRLRHVDF